MGNRARRLYLRALLALERTGLYTKLRCSSIAQYAEEHYRYHHTQTYDDLRVAEALERLPQSAEAFEAGKVGSSALAQVARIATSRTEEEWLELAAKCSVRALKAEVEDAIRNGRDRPRKGKGGLPRLRSTIYFTLEPEEHEIVRKAFRKVGDVLKESLGGKRPEPRETLVYISKLILEGQIPLEAEGNEKDESMYTVLYHVCPSCREGKVHTDEGPVEVPAEVVERVEAEAEKVTISPEEEKAPEKEADNRAKEAAPEEETARKIDRPTPS